MNVSVLSRLCAWLPVVALGVGCAAGPDPYAPVSYTLDSEDSGQSVDALAQDAGPRTTVDVAADVERSAESDTAVQPCRSAGCACALPSDCASGVCQDTDAGKRCSAVCVPTGKPDDQCDGVDDDCDGQTDEQGCDDGDPCTGGDACAAGACAGTPKVCQDDNACTDDACADGQCQHTPNAQACDDGDVCTVSDACVGGTCQGAAKSCDDGDPCTQDSCDAQGCVHTPQDASCDDGDACTEADACVAGKCVGAKITCDDGKTCTSAACDPVKGCVFGPVEMPKSGVPDVSYCAGVQSWTPGALSFEEQVVTLVNQARGKARQCGTKSFKATGPLVMHPALRCAARVHAVDMVQQNYFSHTSKDGKSHAWRIKKACYPGSYLGENIAMGQKSPQQVVQGWLASPGHCANIMRSFYKGIGVGYVAGGKYGHMWVQTFGEVP